MLPQDQITSGALRGPDAVLRIQSPVLEMDDEYKLTNESFVGSLGYLLSGSERSLRHTDTAVEYRVLSMHRESKFALGRIPLDQSPHERSPLESHSSSDNTPAVETSYYAE